MKKKIMILALLGSMVMESKAQVYAGDSWAQFPTMDLYDTGVMNMHMRALAETAALRKQNYYRYSDMALEALNNKQWNYVIYYVNEALNTRYYSGTLYYIRGYANEQLNNLRAAKKDYKTAIKHNCSEASQALANLKIRMKRK